MRLQGSPARGTTGWPRSLVTYAALSSRVIAFLRRSQDHLYTRLFLSESLLAIEAMCYVDQFAFFLHSYSRIPFSTDVNILPCLARSPSGSWANPLPGIAALSTLRMRPATASASFRPNRVTGEGDGGSPPSWADRLPAHCSYWDWDWDTGRCARISMASFLSAA